MVGASWAEIKPDFFKSALYGAVVQTRPGGKGAGVDMVGANHGSTPIPNSHTALPPQTIRRSHRPLRNATLLPSRVLVKRHIHTVDRRIKGFLHVTCADDFGLHHSVACGTSHITH